jgi:hypothetical protein
MYVIKDRISETNVVAPYKCAPHTRKQTESGGSTRQSRLKKVSFSNIEVRKYPLILGDNPSVRSGPPLSIGWEHDPATVVLESVEEYERRKCYRKTLVMSRSEREAILFNLGYSRSEIAKNIRHVIKVKNQRRTTINNLSVAKVEEAVETAKNSVKKIIGFTRKDKNIYEEWKAATADQSKYGHIEGIISHSNDTKILGKCLQNVEGTA